MTSIKLLHVPAHVCHSQGFLEQGNSCWHHLWSWSRQSVPKRLHIKFRRRVITQKKEYSIQNTAEVWNLQG